KLYQARRREFRLEGSEGGGKSRHAHDGLRDRRHGSEFQVKAVSCASRGGGGRAVAWHNQRLPRRLPSIDRKRPEGGNQQIVPWRELPRRPLARACGRW